MMLVFYMCRLSRFSSRSSLGYYKFKYEKPRSANSLLLFHRVYFRYQKVEVWE